MIRLKKFVRAIDKVNCWAGRVIAPILMIIMGVVLVEVIARYIFNSPTMWAFEITQFTFCAVSALAGGYTLLRGKHVNVEILYTIFNKRTRAIIDLVTALIFFAFIGVFLWKSYIMVCESIAIMEHSESAWSPPIYPAKISILIGVFLIFLQGIAKFIRDFYIVVKGTDLNGEGPH